MVKTVFFAFLSRPPDGEVFFQTLLTLQHLRQLLSLIFSILN